MKKHKKEFRKFYQEIVDKFLEDKENIYNFAIKKTNKPHNKTIKSSR